MTPRVNLTLAKAKSFAEGFTPGQRSIVIVSVIALLMGAFVISRWAAQPSWTPLYGNLAGADADAVVTQLTADGVKYKLADGGATVLVPQSQVYAERIAMSGKGLPAGDTQGGWSLLDKQGITATDFQQNIAYQRALEGELGKTLVAMNGVNTAIVHLAVPKKDVFSSATDKTTASVLLSLQPGKTLTNEQVRSVTHLVSGSVASLAPADVTVTDQNGQMLSSADDATSQMTETDQQTASYENRLSKEVQRVLDQVVGVGHSVVRVNTQLDFNATDTTSESYAAPSPTAPPLSQATVNESYMGNGTGAGGTLGAILPTPLASASGSGSYVRNQNTVNNSVNKTVQKVVTAPGAVKRMTVAVVLDTATAGALNQGQVQQMVANSVGLDTTRGDSVQVDTLPFNTSAAAAAKKELDTAAKAQKTTGYIDLAKKVGIALLVLIILFVLMRRRKSDEATIDANASDLPLGTGVILSARESAAIGAREQLAITAAAAKSREQMRTDVASLVDSQPDDVAEMLQGWLAERKV